MSKIAGDINREMTMADMALDAASRDEEIASLEAENKRLREVLKDRRDWFAAQLELHGEGNLSEWDRHALQIECDAADEALSATEQRS